MRIPERAVKKDANRQLLMRRITEQKKSKDIKFGKMFGEREILIFSSVKPKVHGQSNVPPIQIKTSCQELIY